MKNIWTTLQIEPTSDTKVIRLAYAKQLKITHPEDNQKAFQELREAYEKALDEATTIDLDTSPYQGHHIRSIHIRPPDVDHSSSSHSPIIPYIPKVPQITQEENPSEPIFSIRAYKTLQTKIEKRISKVVHALINGRSEDSALFCMGLSVLQNGHFKIFQKLIHAIELSTPEKIGIFKGLNMQAYVHGYTTCVDDIHLRPETTENKSLDINALPPLFRAIYKDDLSLLKQLLAEGVDPHQTMPNGLAPLHVSIQLHRHEFFDALLQYPVDLNQTAAPYHYSPLFIAVKVQNRYAYRKLIELDAKDTPTTWLHTALFAATYNDDLPVVQELISRGSNLYQWAGDGYHTLIYAAARMQHIHVLKELLAHGLDPDMIAGGPEIHPCANYSVIPDVQVTPLTAAFKNRDYETLEILLKAGANPNRQVIGCPALHLAIINPRDFNEDRVYYYDKMSSYHSMIDLLLEYGTDINAKSDDGTTFLIKTILSGQIETAIHLIESGADIQIADSNGKLPIDHAKETRQEQLVKYLEQESRRKPIV